MTENSVVTRSLLPVTCIGYFDSTPHCISILEKAKEKFKCLEWVVMYHLPDNDETKEHWHILIRNHTNSGEINIVPLKTFFEKEFNGQTKSYLFNADFRQCKSEYSFCKYVLHDIEYLASKGEIRNVHYKESDFITNNKGWLNDILKYQPYEEKSHFDLCREYILQGLTDFEILQKLNLSITEINLAYKGLEIMRKLLSF